MGLFSSIGGILGTAAGIALAPATGGMSLALSQGIGGMLGSQVGGMLEGKSGGSSMFSGTGPYSTSSAINDYLLTPEQRAALNSFITTQQAAINQPYSPNEDQTTALEGIRAMQGRYQPLMDTASALALQAGQGYSGGITADEINQFMNPWQQGVTDIAMRRAGTDYGTQLAQLKAKAAGAGAFGGSREALLESQLTNNFNQNIQDIQMTGSAAGYQQALNAVLQNRQGQINAGQGIANIASSGQAYNAKDLGLLMSGGDQEQASSQNYISSQITNMANLMSLAPTQGTKTSQNVAAQPSGIQALAGAAAAGKALGFDPVSKIASLFGVGSGSSNTPIFWNDGRIDMATGGLVRQPRKGISAMTGNYASGGLVDYIQNAMTPASGSRADRALTVTYDALRNLVNDHYSTPRRVAGTIEDFLFSPESPSLSEAYDMNPPDQDYGPHLSGGIASALPSSVNKREDILTANAPEDVQAVSADTGQEAPKQPNLAQAAEQVQAPKDDFNAALFNFGASLMAGGTGSVTGDLANAMKDYSATKMQEAKMDLEKRKTASDIEVQKAQIKKYMSEDKLAQEQLKQTNKFNVNKIDTFQKLATASASNGDMETAKLYQAKVDVESDPDIKNFVLGAVKQGKASVEQVKQTVNRNQIKTMMDGGYLTQQEALAIIKKYGL